MYHLSVNENSKTNSSPKKSRIDRIGKENNDVEYTSFRNKIIETSEKNEAISMNEPANLTKVKIKKSQENDLNFANFAIQEFCDDIEMDMNGVNTVLYVCAKPLNLNLELNPKKKQKNLTKIKLKSNLKP